MIEIIIFKAGDGFGWSSPDIDFEHIDSEFLAEINSAIEKYLVANNKANYKRIRRGERLTTFYR